MISPKVLPVFSKSVTMARVLSMLLDEATMESMALRCASVSVAFCRPCLQAVAISKSSSSAR